MRLPKLLLAIWILLIAVEQVSAIGISPGRTVMHFRPSLEETVSFTVFNGADSQPTKVKLYARGELENLTTISTDIIELEPNDQETFYATIKLTGANYTPGDHVVLVGAVEQIETNKLGNMNVAAVTGVESQVYVRVPYPGKYISASMDIGDMAVGQPVLFTINVNSLGSDYIDSIEAHIDLFDPKGDKVASLTSTKEDLNPKESKDLFAEWMPSDVSPGIYLAVATVYYDGKSVKTETNFRLGDMIVEIADVTTEALGSSIVRFEITAQSKWNDAIKNVYATVNISDSGKNPIATITTPPVTIPRWSQEKLETFLKTDNIDEGMYDATVILYYEGNTTKRDLQFQVSKTKNKIEPAYIVIAALLITIACLLISSRRRKDEKNKH